MCVYVQVDDLRSKEATHERSMFAIAQENKKMSEPMRKAIEEVKRLRDEREAYQKDLADLAEVKAHVLVVTDRLENLRWEHEILQQRFVSLAGERDALYERFQAALHDVKQKSGFRSLLLEKRLGAAATEVERQSVMLSEVLVAARLDPRVLGPLERQLADVVASKDGAVRELEAELERVAGAHDRLLDFFAAKMREYGIPAAELGFAPLRSYDILRSSGLAAAATATAVAAAALGAAAGAATGGPAFESAEGGGPSLFAASSIPPPSRTVASGSGSASAGLRGDSAIGGAGAPSR